jgi:hypothetical protein
MRLSQVHSEEQAALSRTDRLQLDYQQTTDLLRTLTDVRFKLLALIPTLSGAAVAFVGPTAVPVQLLTLGGLGLTATVGVLLYDLRNSEVYDYALRRAQQLETELQIAVAADSMPGGLFGERPSGTVRLFGVTADRDRGLALVYSAALGGWTYLVIWGALRAAHLGHARDIGAAIGLGAALLVLTELIRIHPRSTSTANT